MADTTWDWDDQLEEVQTGFTRNDRISSVLVLVVTGVAIVLGLVILQRAAAQEWTYSSRAVGIEAAYPSGWLVDEGGDYTVRVRDPKARPFKTQYQIDIVPAGGQTSIRNVLDGLTIQRSTDLAAYRVLNVQDVTIGGTTYTQMSFSFVDADPNPFIQRLPTVVLGNDIVIRDGDRVIIVTYMAAEDAYDENFSNFERFFNSLQY